jgi:hypothetical protein
MNGHILKIIRFFSHPKLPEYWAWNSIFLPFLLSRLVWELVGHFAHGTFAPNPNHPDLPLYAERGYMMTPHLFLDIFTRWDSNWYFSIIQLGYQTSGELSRAFSNMAFLPLYPYLVKSLGWLGFDLPVSYYIMFGLLLSNLFFLLAAMLLYRFAVVDMELGAGAAHRSLILLFAFPTSFYFACFYTESLFLFLCLAAVTSALREKWMYAGTFAALGILTRPQGVALFIAISWLYMEKRRWNVRAIGLSVGWLALAPIALTAHFYYLYLQSGRVVAFFESISAWGRAVDISRTSLFWNLRKPLLDMPKFDLFFLTIFLSASLYLFWRSSIRANGVLAVLMCLMPICSGMLTGFSRYALLVFPVFLLFGEKLRNQSIFLSAVTISFAMQIVFFVGWVNYYWIA